MIDGWLQDEINTHKRVFRWGTIIDVGANDGDFAAEFMPITHRVIAIEPIPSYERNIHDKSPLIEVISKAASNKEGEETLTIPHISADAKLWTWATIKPEFAASVKIYELKIQTITLDSLTIQDTTHIKIDVEGAELEVIQGALKTIETSRPFISVELEERHRKGCTKVVPEFMETLNYSTYFLANNTYVPIHDFNANTHQLCEDSVGGQTIGTYINTFYLAPNENAWIRNKLIPS